MKNGCMENKTYRLNWVFVDKINESLFEAVANDMGKFPEKYKNVKVVERDKIIEALKNVDNYLQKIAELEQELAELKQQLAEKDQEIEELNDKLEWKSKWLKIADNMVGHYEKSNQDKISFAIEQLEKVKEWLESKYFDNEQINYLTKIIDNQINKLKGKVEDAKQ